MNRELLENGIIRCGTPAYIFDIDEMKTTVTEFRSIFGKNAEICYAMKANPFLTEYMEKVTDRIEVCSMGEFQICRELGIPYEKLLISGVLKEKRDIREILNTCGGACVYTAESLSQLSSFEDWARLNRQVLNIYLRLSNGTQFGMDRRTIRNIIETKDFYPYLRFSGLHYFTGTQKKTSRKAVEELEELDRFLKSLKKELGFQMEHLEYGPGISVPYFQDQKDDRLLQMKEIAQAAKQMTWGGKLTLEMGRALAAPCGYYLTSVRDVKKNDGKSYCIVDGGIHQLHYDGQIRGMYLPRYQLIPEFADEPKQEWTVCGALCTFNDVLMQKASARGLKTGSIFVFEQAGAYSMTEGMALFLSHPLPKVVLYSKEKGWELLRQRQPVYQWNMGKGDTNGYTFKNTDRD